MTNLCTRCQKAHRMSFHDKPTPNPSQCAICRAPLPVEAKGGRVAPNIPIVTAEGEIVAPAGDIEMPKPSGDVGYWSPPEG